MKIAYFVHDLLDAAVRRRVRMLRAASAHVILIGFRRAANCPAEIEGCETFDLGETRDGAFVARAGSVAVAAIQLRRLSDLLHGCDVVLARNLEMLALAARARRRYAPAATLVSECLDIHRLLLSRSTLGRLLRATETRLMRDVDLVLTSSPRFIAEYFAPRNFNRPIMLLENKVFVDRCATMVSNPRPSQGGPPWKIGWFGMIRCRRSFEILRAVADAVGGNLQVKIAGRPSQKEFPDFERLVAASPHLHFTGPYQAEDLPGLYGNVHFSWSVDFFEQGLNSSWLLPNRIYESTLFGAVPIAVADVETARWLGERRIGAILKGDPERSLGELIRGMTADKYARLRSALQDVQRGDLMDTPQNCCELVAALKRPALSHNRC